MHKDTIPTVPWSPWWNEVEQVPTLSSVCERGRQLSKLQQCTCLSRVSRFGGGKRRRQGTSTGLVFAGRHTLLNNPIFYVVYYILISGVFAASCFKPGGKGVPRSSRPWAETYAVEFSTTDDLFHTLKTMWGPVTLRSVTDSTEQLVWCLMHMRSMLHDISVICYLRRICICTSYYCELVVGLRTQFYTLLEVWGGWELGC